MCVIRELPVIESVNWKKKMKDSRDFMNYTFTVKSDLPKLSSVNRDLKIRFREHQITEIPLIYNKQNACNLSVDMF